MPFHAWGSEPVFPLGEQRARSGAAASLLIQVPFLEVPVALPRSVGLHGAGGLPSPMLPSISDAQPVLTWVEIWICPDPEVSAGVPPSSRMGCYPHRCAGVVLGAVFTPILANPRKSCSGNLTPPGARANVAPSAQGQPPRGHGGHVGRGQTLSPLCWGTCTCWWVCSRVCALLLLWDKHAGWKTFLLLLLLPQPGATGAMPAAAAGQEPSRCQVSVALRASRSTSTSG